MEKVVIVAYREHASANRTSHSGTARYDMSEGKYATPATHFLLLVLWDMHGPDYRFGLVVVNTVLLHKAQVLERGEATVWGTWDHMHRSMTHALRGADACALALACRAGLGAGPEGNGGANGRMWLHGRLGAGPEGNGGANGRMWLHGRQVFCLPPRWQGSSARRTGAQCCRRSGADWQGVTANWVVPRRPG